MKKMIPLWLAAFSIALFLIMIGRHEWHLAHSGSIYVKLKPVDPRSILQGDYMALNYELYLAEQPPAMELIEDHLPSDAEKAYFYNQSSILSYVQLDAQRRVIQTRFDPQLLNDYPGASAKLVLRNPHNTFEGLYPAARSFLFAEGLEPCYRNAQFAELKVRENGQPLLVNLVGENLKALNCEQQNDWWQGSHN
ncbi:MULTISPECIES: GDYXXLXY domain-containing protein [Acinetobacter]|uniref:GDYXXLXY protein n=2 Tax=Acinetobacter TaxID=469 RepID=A0A4Q7AUQ1_9GAMM|nr:MULTISPECIES: GDYXXLXY domain-containing protein [Acinetobacter]MCW8038836.1 GDYXXLXY domain-containing protein [Acinetobacter entericus]RZG66111.1 GDYXXLXY protein [Acinetobacter bouvetii]TCB74181.1 GDYXXLXY protein [Acinetobacter sp. ANC 4177]